MLVIAGYLGLFGIVLSTFSAHPLITHNPWYAPKVYRNPTRSSSAARRSRSGLAPTSDESFPCASYARYSSELQAETSIQDQQRCCREAAARENHVIACELEFADAATSGTKLERDGLNKMLRTAEEHRFQCLYFYSLSRLARESVITMPMLKKLVYVDNVRIVSVTEGIDSAREGWDMMAGLFSIIAERYIADLSKSVFRGQEGTVLAGLAVGDHCFGFNSVPVPGSENQSRGRNPKPRMTYVIDETTSPWVARIFDWFVKERRSIRWITQQLNLQGAPKDHRATTKDWHHQYVTKLLSNPKYVGIWPWGQTQNKRNHLNGNVHQEDRPEHESEKWTRKMPHLRLVDDEIWSEAQKILERNRKKHEHHHKPDGTWAGSTSGNSAHHPRHLVSRLIQCQSCQSFLSGGGSDGRYMLCPGYLRGRCTCKTQLRRDIAEKLILNAISTQILSDAVWKKSDSR